MTFTPEDEGTRVDLVHRGWERFDDPTHATRGEYDGNGGWTQVLARYTTALEE